MLHSIGRKNSRRESRQVWKILACMESAFINRSGFASGSYATIFDKPVALIECLKRRGLCWRDNIDKMGSPGRWRSFIRLFQFVHTLEHQFIIFPPILQLKSFISGFSAHRTCISSDHCVYINVIRPLCRHPNHQVVVPVA